MHVDNNFWQFWQFACWEERTFKGQVSRIFDFVIWSDDFGMLDGELARTEVAEAVDVALGSYEKIREMVDVVEQVHW